MSLLTCTGRVALLLFMLGCAALASARNFILYAGSYTAGSSQGIYAWQFDSYSGALSPLGLMAATPQPAHIWIAPNGRFLYAVNWESEGGVSAFRIDPHDAHLIFLGRVSSQGIRPNQVVLDPSGRIASTVNYTSGSLAAYAVLPDGRLSGAFYVDQHSGTALSGAQSGPRAHGIVFSRDGRFMFATDLGLDRIYVYRVDAHARSVSPVEPAFVTLHAGAGPRRLQLSPDNRFLYVNHETDSEVSVFAVNGGHLNEVQTLSTRSPGASGVNTTAEIMIDGAGRHLYVSNRGDDSIAVFGIDRSTGRLTLQADVATGGRTPRNIRLDPTGRYLLCANEDSGTITVLEVNASTGMPRLTGSVGRIDTPGGLYFLAK